MALELSAEEVSEFEAELARLKQEHRDLDTAIEALESMVAGDQLQIQRLKKRKLALKDRISSLEDQITPDIIAGARRPCAGKTAWLFAPRRREEPSEAAGSHRSPLERV